MNSRKLIVYLLLFALSLLAIGFYVASQKATRRTAQTPSQTQPGFEEASVPTSQAEPEPTTAPTTKPVSAVAQAEAPALAEPTQAEDTLEIYAGESPERLVNLGSLDPRSGYKFQAELSSRGAAIRRLKLSEHFATVSDKRLYNAGPDNYERIRLQDPDKYKGHYALLAPVGQDGQSQQLALATGRLRLSIEGESRPIANNPLDLSKWNWSCVSADLPEGKTDCQTAVFEIVLHAGATELDARPLLRVRKTYSLSKTDYSVDVRLTLENLSQQQLELTVEQAGATGISKESYQNDMRRAAYGRLDTEGQRVQPKLEGIGDAQKIAQGDENLIGRSSDEDPVLWVGFVNKFFGSMMYLRPVAEGRLEAIAYGAEFYLRSAEERPGMVTYLTGVRIPKLQVKPGRAWDIDFDVYAGPKRRDTFTNEKDESFRPLYKELNYIGTIDFGGCPCAFNWLTLAMMWLLSFFSSTVAFGNYGVAIIILVLLVRLVLHPLTKKSQVSMMRMQKLAPQMQKLKEKYADDKNALNREMMKLYKEQGTTPLLGCLPMFLQMPIWVALFTGLRAAVELRHAAFLPVWITDLSAPDALLALPWDLPFVGASFNLLPILLGIAMFFQQKFTPTTAQPGAGSDQAQQTQKMMKYMFPLMLPVLFYKAPSGLTLYIMASTFAGVLDQYFVRKHIREKEAEEAARQTTITVPGKVARTSRPKKPKGPFWVKRG